MALRFKPYSHLKSRLLSITKDLHPVSPNSLFKFHSYQRLRNETYRNVSSVSLVKSHSFFKLNKNIFSYKSLELEFKFNNKFGNLIKARSFSTSSWMFKKKMDSVKRRQVKSTSETFTEEEFLEDKKFDSLVAKCGGSLLGVSSIAVIQPWIKWGSKKRYQTTPEILLDEACALIKSLPFVRVSLKEFVPLQHVSKTHIFGSGSLEKLVNDVKNSNSQAVFISIDHLSRVQKSELEDTFGVKVFDRYFIVLAIFKHHASTIESRLQIAMAELPFMSKRFLHDKEKVILDQRESKLKEALRRLAGRREKVRKTRQKSSLPTVAVVGYTNCGKTTLIRALTGDERAQGEDRLFATLDVTAHKGKLPCGLNVLFLDSVGFIQDIPTSLIASFQATLQDTIYADVVVLVRDISHPDLIGQMQTVRGTLKDLPLPEHTPVVVVNNKADLLPRCGQEEEDLQERGIFASAVGGDGLNEVIERVEKEILKVTGRKVYHLRLLTGSAKIEWLNEMAGVCYEEIDENDPQYTCIQVVMNEAEKAAFRRAFKS